MATSCSVSSNKVKYDGRYLKVTCTQTPQTGKGKSTIYWKLEVLGGNYEWYSTGPTTVKIGSKQVYYCARQNYDVGKFPVAKGSIDGTIEYDHNADGSLTIDVSITTAIYYNASTAKTDTVTWTLDPVYKSASLTAAPDFNDEENPTITYSNPAGNDVTTLQACIASPDGVTIYVPYRDITKTGTTYQFPLTTTERTALRNACPTANSMKVKFYVKTVNSGNTYYSSLEKTMTIVNAKPTFNASVIDEGVNSKVLTGDVNNKLIKHFNYVKYSSGAEGVKGATIVSQSVTCGSKTVNNGSGYMSNVESDTFVFKVKDSRGNENSTTITKTLIPYVPLTCTFDAKNPTADGNMTLIIKGNYFNGSFGAKSNSLTVQYKMLKDGAAYKDWTTATNTKSGNTYTATVNLTGLDYQSIYTIETRAQDEVLKCDSKYAPTTSNAKKFKTSPIFDWSDEDFAFNVPISTPQIDATNISGTNVRQNGLKVVGYNGHASNFNTAYTIGYYYAAGTDITGAPYTGNIYGVLEVRVTPGDTYNQKDNWCWQIFKDTSGREYHRVAVNAGGFGAWSRVPNKFDIIYPVGSVYISSTNTNPSGNFGGTWTLIDKGFNPGLIQNAYTLNTTNCSAASINVHRSDHSITITGYVDNKVAFTDTTQDLFTLNLSSIGISAFPDTMRWVGYSDGGNSMLQMTMNSSGLVQKVDVEYSLTSVAAGKTWVFSFTSVIDDSAMLDSACNRFYWRRDA